MKASQTRTGGRHVAIERGLLKNRRDWLLKSPKKLRGKKKPQS